MSATSDLAIESPSDLVCQSPPSGEPWGTLSSPGDKNKYRNWFLTINNPTPSDNQGLIELEGVCRYACVAKEVGKECGTLHLHVVVVFQNQIRFDTVKGMFPRANIQVIRSLPHAIKYVKKDGDFHEIGKCPRLPGTKEASPLNEVAEAVKKGATMRDIARDFPVETIRYSRGIAELVRLTASSTEGDRWYGPYQQPMISDWSRTHVVMGASGVGKSQWAKSHFEPGKVLIVSHMDDLLKFNPQVHDGIIFDDMEFKYLPRTTQIHLTDQDEDRSLHCRYQTAFIPSGTKKIMTANEMPVEINDPAIARRVHVTDYS